jgi:hypothetical protein
VPLFWSFHVFVKEVPAASWVPSGMVTSLMNVALSHVVPGIISLRVGEGLSVSSGVAVEEGVGVVDGGGVAVKVLVAVGSLTVAIPAFTVRATSVNTTSADSVGVADLQAVKPIMRTRKLHSSIFL